LPLLYTDDGGETWRKTDLPVTSFYNAFVLDLKHWWIQLGGPSYQVWATNDGGTNWKQSQAPDSRRFAGQMDFVDPLRGWIGAPGLGAAGSNEFDVYRTVDGGVSWTTVATGKPGDPAVASPGHLPGRCDKAAASFISATTGWLTGRCAGGDPVFYATHDAGSTWQAQHLPIRGLSQGYMRDCDGEVRAPVFTSASSGYLVMTCVIQSGPRNILYATHNAGSTWAGQNLPTNHTLAIAGDGAKDYWFAGAMTSDANATQVMYASHDEGAQWTQLEPGFSINDILALDFVDAQTGWMAVAATYGSSSKPNTSLLYRTTDGGKTWQNLGYKVVGL
jgi:photosystem II stability/assembly factor-like uncharacterized protein